MLLQNVLRPYNTEDIKTVLLKRLISAAVSAAERLHERCFPFAAAVHFCDCCGNDTESCRSASVNMQKNSHMVDKQLSCSAVQRW